MIIPWVPVASIRALEEGSELLERLTKALEGYGIGGPVRLELPSAVWEAESGEAVRQAKSNARPEWMRVLSNAADITAGPVPVRDIDLVTSVLDSGFVRAVVDVKSVDDVEALRAAAEHVPMSRLVVRITLPSTCVDSTWNTDVFAPLLAPFLGEIGGVEFDMSELSAEGLSSEQILQVLRKLRTFVKENGGESAATVARLSGRVLAAQEAQGGKEFVREDDALSREGGAQLIGKAHLDTHVHIIAPAVLPGFVIHGRAPSGSGGSGEGGSGEVGGGEWGAGRSVGYLESVVQFGEADVHGAVEIGAVVANCARTDRPDGLFTTVVTDELGVALGLVYSSPGSLVTSVRCGRGVYFSRSRSGLWRKGDTSGAWQSLLALRLDCDSDAVLARVIQHGEPPSFCHTGARTCWLENQGIGALERTLTARRKSAPPGSYTKRLFEDPTLLRNKLVEEAQELAEATDPDHIAAEAADVIYFALVRCAAAGVPLMHAEKHLHRRTLAVRRRKGDSKKHRIEKADEILKTTKEG